MDDGWNAGSILRRRCESVPSRCQGFLAAADILAERLSERAIPKSNSPELGSIANRKRLATKVKDVI
jgi:hypothetical protein